MRGRSEHEGEDSVRQIVALPSAWQNMGLESLEDFLVPFILIYKKRGKISRPFMLFGRNGQRKDTFPRYFCHNML